MTVATSTNRVTYNGDGSTTAFPFTTFGIFAASELKVIKRSSAGVETTLTLNADYAVTLTTPAALPSVGHIDLLGAYLASPPIAGETLLLYRDLPMTQLISVAEGGPLPAASLNESHDRAVMLLQQLSEALGRSVQLPISSSFSGLTLPDPVALHFLRWNAAATALENMLVVSPGALSVSTFIETLLDDIDAATARATLGAQASHANLAALAGLSGAARKFPYFTASGAMALSDSPELVSNLKPTVNAAVNKLDIFTKSGGAVPDASNPITVAIPDGNGHTFRTRAAAYLSGTSQIILADAANYWGKGSLDAEIKTAWLYAIWDGTGIVWALGGYSGFNVVPTTTTVTDDDYFLLEASSTYTRNAAHYCVPVAKIRYQYDTADTPDHTIQASGGLAPQVIWGSKSDYGKSVLLVTTATAAVDFAEQSPLSVVVKQSGVFRADARAYGDASGAAPSLQVFVKSGSATYGSAIYKARSALMVGAATISASTFAEFSVNAGDTVHFGFALSAPSGTRRLYGEDSLLGVTGLTIRRCD